MDRMVRRPASLAILLCAFSWVSAAIPADATLHDIDGTDFPDHAIALFYDDGPDTHSLELADYLHAHGVSAS
jgi:hypothetical protein